MIKRLYQYADIPLTIGNQAIFTPQNTSWAGDIGSYTHSYKRFSNSHRFIHQPTVLGFNGELIYDNNLLPAEIEQKLRSFIGFTDTLIIYVLPNDYPPQFDLCEPCESCIDCEVMWLSAPAILTSVNVDGDADNGFKIDLQFTLMDFFYPLNKFMWKYNGNYVQDYDSRELPINSDIYSLINCYPKCSDLFTDCISCRFFSRLNYNTFDAFYNPFTWEAMANDDCCDYRYLFASNYEALLVPGEVTSFVPSFYAPEKIFQIDPKKWGAPLSSIYAFRGVVDNAYFYSSCYHFTENAGITISNAYNFGTVTKTEETFIPMSYFPDYPYTLLVGNISYYDSVLGKIFRPAMVVDGLLDNPVVIDVHPLITYPSFSPGQLYPGRNKVKINVNLEKEPNYVGCEDSGTYTQQFIEYAYIHLFRRV